MHIVYLPRHPEVVSLEAPQLILYVMSDQAIDTHERSGVS